MAFGESVSVPENGSNGSHSHTSSESSPFNIFAVNSHVLSIQYSRGEKIVNSWRRWLWLIALSDFASVITIVAWASSNQATILSQAQANAIYEKRLVITVFVCLSYFFQNAIGVMLTLGLCVCDAVFLVKCLGVYLICSCILLVANIFIMVNTITVLSKSHINGFEECQGVLAFAANMIIKTIVAFVVKKILSSYFNSVYLQQLYESRSF